MSQHIELTNSSSSPAAVDLRAPNSSSVDGPAASAALDDNYLRKKFKKRDRSPSSMALNESPPSSSSAVLTTTVVGELAGPSCPVSGTATTTQLQKKEKQRPETWNKNEQQIFFNALRQNGKNFESITQYFNARQKRYKIDDGATVQRSKEQIRHFYYRTWHKIIKYISLPALKDGSASSENNQSSWLRDIQVNCLIAFNALMNKLHRWNKKSAVKLVELVNHGWTTVREKGKITRLRMPICKVSSKTIAVDSESVNQLPATIQLQLEPRNEAAYCRVHKLAQNPFLSIEIQTLQSVKFLIEFLENKWKNRRNQYMDKFQINDDQSSTGGKSLAKTSVSDSETETTNGEKRAHSLNNNNSGGEAALDNFSERLVLFPSESHQISNLDLYEASGYLVHDDQAEPDPMAATASFALSCLATSALAATPTVQQAKTMSSIGVENRDPPSELAVVDMRIKLKSPLRPEDQDLPALAVQQSAALTTTAASSSSANRQQSTPGASSKSTSKQPDAAEEEMADEATTGTPNRSAQKKSFSRICYQLTAEQLRAGVTASSCSLTTTTTTSSQSNSKESKDLTFIQLYLALNKPKVISLKYDWLSSVGANSFKSLASIQNQQQRFYIDTLASVASSYLNELTQRVKSAPASSTSDNQTATPSSAAVQAQAPIKAAASAVNLASSNNNTSQVSLKKATSPTKMPATMAGPFTSAANMPSSVAILQPNTGTTTVVPIDVMLKRIAEEQTNKTKKLLSDLNSKRRTRQRKPIMVVNSGNPPRTMLPKLSINGQQLIITPINLDMTMSTNLTNNAAPLTVSSAGNSANSLNTSTASGASAGALMDATSTQQQQNIVYSGPVAAVARQIVNPTSQSLVSQLSTTNMEMSQQQQQQQQNAAAYSSSGANYQELISHQIPQSSKLAIPSFHQAYSNLIPQIAAAADSSNNNGQHHQHNKTSSSSSNEVANLASPPNLTDMSLLELSINNSDSLFGLQSASNQPVVSTKFGDISKRDILSDAAATSTAAKKSSEMDSACVINLNDSSNLSNLSTLNNILNSLTCKSGGEENSSSAAADMKLSESNKATNMADMNDHNHHHGGAAMSSNNGASSGGFSLTHKRSEALLVEWTDSMNDVSLTGCFLNDIQSPEKPSKTSGSIVHVLNENSRDSIFFNLDTIMDIIPPVANRYDESSLITSLTSPTPLNNIGNSDS